MILDEFDAVLISLFTYQFSDFFTVSLFYSAALSRVIGKYFHFPDISINS